MKIRYFVLGFLVGVLLSGFFLVLFIRHPFQSTPSKLSKVSDGPTEYVSEGVIGTFEGKININVATVNELIGLPGIGPAKATSIVDFRNKYGPFSSIDELLYVPGIGENQLSEIRSLIYAK